MQAAGSREDHRPLLAFFVLVFALSVPFWVVGEIVHGELLPGLPVSALALISPVVAASIILYRRRGLKGVAELLRRSADFERIRRKRWYVPTLLLMPGVFALAYGVMLVLQRPMPAPQFDLAGVPVLILLFFVGGLAEELGWSGYATNPMQRRWGALGAALLLGGFWAAWHWIPLLQAERDLSWIAWWSVGTVALRVLHVWIYTNTGHSVFGQALFHATFNLAWQLFPNSGSQYDPVVVSPIIVAAAALAVALWGPRTLAGERAGPRERHQRDA